MNDFQKIKREKIRKLDKLKNKKLVTILNHKMFKGYRDIKASKWFSNQKPKYVSDLEWEYKNFDPFDDLYNLNYKMNVLYPLKTPNFNNLLLIENFPSKERKIIRKTSRNDNRPKTSFNSFTSSNNIITTAGSKSKSKIKNKKNMKNGFYLTAMSVYQTDNFYHEYNPKRTYKQIFENDKVIYNDIPILSLDKVKYYNKNYHKKDNSKKKPKNQNINKNNKNAPQSFIYVKNTQNEIIQTNNIHDDVYNGLTEKQFLYKISHNKSNKSINEKININAFRKNKGFVKGFVSKRLKSAHPIQTLGLPSLNKKTTGPQGITIELEYDDIGNMKTKKMYTTNEHNYQEEILNGYSNNFLIYNGGNNIDTHSNKNRTQTRARSSSYKESETEDFIFGNPFKKNKNNNDNLSPPLRVFESKPRIFDDKLLLQFKLDKKNQFLRLKNIME
jgi:hypothetical protein